MALLTATPTPAVAVRPGRGIRATVASALGFTLDFYDLYVAVFVAPVIAHVFFPGGNKMLSLAAAFGTLAATLLMRPVGAALMGGIADRYGRRTAMIVSLLGVGTVTALTGTLPTQAAAGVLAPILLLTFRLAQGLFVGGVFASTLTLAIETVRPRWRGLVSGVVGGGGTTVGSVLASLSFLAATQLFPGAAFDEWGWRAMFFAGGLPVLLSLFVLRFVDESPLFVPGQSNGHPVRAVFTRRYRWLLILNIPIVFGIATHFLLSIGFLPTYLQVVNHLPVSTVSRMLVLVNLATLAFAPLTGHLSQVLGRKRVMLSVAIINTAVLPVLYWRLSHLHGGSMLIPIVAVSVLVSCLTVAAFGSLPVFLNERFPTALRASGVALSINIGFAVAGLVPTTVNALSGSVERLPMFTIGALIIAGLATIIGLSRTTEPDRTLG